MLSGAKHLAEDESDVPPGGMAPEAPTSSALGGFSMTRRSGEGLPPYFVSLVLLVEPFL